MNAHKQHAGVWLAFSAGMFADATVAAGAFTDEQLEYEAARDFFLIANHSALEALGVSNEDAIRVFDKGRVFMAELREKGAPIPLPKAEDSMPNECTGPERQLTAKPNGRLS